MRVGRGFRGALILVAQLDLGTIAGVGNDFIRCVRRGEHEVVEVVIGRNWSVASSLGTNIRLCCKRI